MSYNKLKKRALWVWQQTENFRLKIFFFIFLEILSLGCSLLFIYWSKKAVDMAVGNIEGNLKLSLIYVVIFIILGVLFGLISSWISERMRISMRLDLQQKLIESQLALDWKKVKKWHTGDLLVRINSDCQEVVQMLTYSLPSFFVTIIKLIASVAFLWIMDPMLAWMLLCISPLFLFSKIYYKKVRTLNKKVKESLSKQGTLIQEGLKNRLLIKALNVGKTYMGKIQEMQDHVSFLEVKQLKFATSTQAIIKYTFNGGYLLAFIWGIYRLHEQEISFGTMTAFLQLVNKVQLPMLAMMAFVPMAIRSINSIDRLMELYHKDSDDNRKLLKIENICGIIVQNLSFKYDDLDIIKNLNVTLEVGKPTAVVGASGKGKTTFIRLLLALLRPDRGSIVFKTNEGKEYPLTAETRTNFAYVPQGNSLFTGTIRENLSLVNNLVTEIKLKNALDLAGATFVYELPDGIDTKIGESGYGFSEGQAQRIAIARALLQEKPIWLFDEITSALDKKNSSQIIDTLLDIGKEKILIFVTHDMVLAEKCSQTIKIN